MYLYLVRILVLERKYLLNNELLEEMIKTVSDEFYKLLKDSMLDLSLTKEEYEEKNKHKIELQLAIKDCIFQNEKAKELVKFEIRKILENNYSLNSFTIDDAINFNDNVKLPTNIMFDILIYKMRKEHDKDALSYMIDKYNLCDLKFDEGEYRYAITDGDIANIYMKEKINLSYDEKLDILVSYIYSRYKGFGVCDDLLEMNVDGINGGVSGNEFDGSNLRSIWVIYKGKNIHLKFLSFDNENELRRICLNIYKFDSPGELSKSDGYKINKMKDGSRIVVIRPDLSESWAFFLRKFHASNLPLNQIITAKNSDKIINLLKFITMGCNNICISGQQGSGKTTMLLNLIEFIYPVYPIRAQETSFELNMRKKFPNRNILTIQETDEISGQKGLDLLKKTDGLINVIGEVASDEVATQLIQSGKVACKATLFTHHAKSTNMLIKSLRNSLLKTGVFKNEDVAIEEVASVINFDIHLEKDFYGNRYIEKINECVFDNETGKYEIVELARFDNNNACYVLSNTLSKNAITKILNEIKNDDKDEFNKFLLDTYGIEL